MMLVNANYLEDDTWNFVLSILPCLLPQLLPSYLLVLDVL